MIDSLPDATQNGSFDGSQDSFWFGDKQIVTWNIARHDLEAFGAKMNARLQAAKNASVIEGMEKIKKAMQYENVICDIYNEIAEVINRHAPEFQLPLL